MSLHIFEYPIIQDFFSPWVILGRIHLINEIFLYFSVDSFLFMFNFYIQQFLFLEIKKYYTRVLKILINGNYMSI